MYSSDDGTSSSYTVLRGLVSRRDVSLYGLKISPEPDPTHICHKGAGVSTDTLLLVHYEATTGRATRRASGLEVLRTVGADGLCTNMGRSGPR